MRWGERNLLSVGGERRGLTVSFESLIAQKASLACFELPLVTPLTRDTIIDFVFGWTIDSLQLVNTAYFFSCLALP